MNRMEEVWKPRIRRILRIQTGAPEEGNHNGSAADMDAQRHQKTGKATKGRLGTTGVESHATIRGGSGGGDHAGGDDVSTRQASAIPLDGRAADFDAIVP